MRPFQGGAERPLRVMVVDDSSADVALLKQAFASADVPTELFTAGDGDEALRILGKGGAPRPDLMLLDINMPGISGLDVLKEIKTRENLRSIVVMMFTSSSSPDDVERAYEYQANGYLVKPNDLDRYFHMARSVAEFWTLRSTLPSTTN